jgi:non-ribosomal peptide synthetase component F
VPAFRGGTCRLVLAGDVAGRLREAAADLRVTPFAFALAAFQALLHRYTGRDDFLVGCPATTRRDPLTRPLVGHFVNTLPLRARIGPAATFAELALAAHRQLAAGMANAGYPCALVTTGRSGPLYRVACTLVATDRLEPPLPLVAEGSMVGAEIVDHGLRLSLVDVSQQEGQLDLMVRLHYGGDSMEAVFLYDTDLYDRETVERWTRHFALLVEAAIADPTTAVSAPSLVADEDVARLLALGTGAPSGR